MTHDKVAKAVAIDAVNTLNEILKALTDVRLTDREKLQAIRQEILIFTHRKSMTELLEKKKASCCAECDMAVPNADMGAYECSRDHGLRYGWQSCEEA